MPSSVASTCIGAGIVVALAGVAWLALILAGCALVFEGILFLFGGIE